MAARDRYRRLLAGGVLAAGLLIGCAEDAPVAAPPRRNWKPVGEQLIDLDGRLRDTPFRVLLGFETDSDLTFIAGAPGARRDGSMLHSGPASLALPAGTRSFAVKLSSLLPASPFPGAWTLLGAYLYSNAPTTVVVSYEAGGKTLARRTVSLPPRRWTAAMLDVSPLTDPNSPPPPGPGLLRFTPADPAAPLWCDDAMVVDNTRTLVSGDLSNDGWTVGVRGFKTILDRPGKFSLAVDTADAPDGWRLEEANHLRARFSGAGKRVWTVYSDGVAYLDGKVDSLAAPPAPARAALAAQHDSPAELSVPEEMGRVERNSPGDRNNDGYAEMTGAYQLKATGPRLTVTVRPRTAALVRPVLEIAGFPDGRVTGTVEGQLIDKAVRLPDGHVLVQLPGTIDRDVTVELKVR